MVTTSSLSNAYTNSATTGTAAASTASTTSSTVSDAVLARVEKVLASQSTGVVKLNNTLSADQTKLSGLGQLQSALADFQTRAQAMAGAGLSTSATSSSKDVLGVSTGASAAAGTYAVDVKQLAQGQVLATAAQSASTGKIGSGTSSVIKIEYGSVGATGFSAGKTAATSITIDSSNNTLDGIAAALKKAGVDAAVVKSDSGYTLSISGPDGSAGSMRISVTGDSAVNKLMAYNPDGTQNLKQSSVAQDALLTVGGKDITSASNTVADAIAGTTLTLTKAGSTNVVVSQDSSQIASNVASFVSAYNALSDKLATLKKSGLGDDASLSQATSQLAQIAKGGGGGASAMAKIGLSVGSDGKLVLDSDKLKSAIAADPAAVSKLFTNDNGTGIADQMAARITTLTGDDGRIAKQLTTVNKEIATLTDKKAALATALTAQAQALAAIYSEQESSSSGGGTSLFDFMA